MQHVVLEYAAAKNRHDPRAALEWCTDDFALEIVPLGERIVATLLAQAGLPMPSVGGHPAPSAPPLR